MKLSSLASFVKLQGALGWLARGLGTFGNFVLLGPEVAEQAEDAGSGVGTRVVNG